MKIKHIYTHMGYIQSRTYSLVTDGAQFFFSTSLETYQTVLLVHFLLALLEMGLASLGGRPLIFFWWGESPHELLSLSF